MEEKELFSGLFSIYPKILIPIGLICNILNIVLFTTRKLSKVSISIFIKILAINDIFNLLNLSFWLFDGPYHQNLSDKNAIMCKVVGFISFIFLGINAWILVLISFDRLIMILFPIKPKVFMYKYFNFMVCLIIYLYNCLLFLPSIFFFDLIELPDSFISNKTLCLPLHSIYGKIIAKFELFSSVILPFLSMFFISVLIIVSLKKSKNKVNNGFESRTKRRHKDLKFSVTILSINFVFLLLTLPMAIGYALENNLIINFGNLFVTIFFSLNFFIHMLTNSIVREEILLLFRIKLKKFKMNFSKTFK